MRKNNFVKIFVSLVMCLMLGLSLVACGGNGENGANGKDGVGISNVALEDGKLTITYTDGKTQSFDMAAASTACAHEKVETAEIVKHTKTENGVYLEICADCDAVKVKNAVIHNFVENDVAATCVEKAYKLSACHCGEVEGEKAYYGELADHTWTAKNYVKEDGKTICDDGGILLQYCSYCKLTNQVEVEATGCVVKEWKAPVVAEDYVYAATAAPVLEGKCVQCGATETKTLPAFDEEGYELKVTVAKADCSDANGKGEFTYTVAETNQKFTFVAKLAATEHVLNGAPVSESMIVVNGNEYLDYTVGNVGILAGQTLACEKELAAFYTCEVCKKVATETAFRCHKGTAVAGSVATVTCTTSGTISIEECTLCGEGKGDATVTATVPATGHNYAYGYTTEIEDDEVVVTSIYKTCVNKVGTALCGDTVNITGYTDAAVSVIKASTCKELGEARISYKLLGEEVVVSATLDYSAHAFNGKLENEYDGVAYVGGVAYFDVSTKGIELFAGATLGKEVCGTDTAVGGFYKCDVCAGTVSVMVTREHTLTDVKVTLEPTCKTEGKKSGKCTFCEKTVTDLAIPTVDHDLEYDVEEIAEDTYQLVAVCKFAVAGETACDYVNVPEEVSNVREVIVESTCAKKGTKTLYYTIDGKEKSKVTELALAPHTLKGDEIVANATGVDYNKYLTAIQFFAGAEAIKCGDTNKNAFFVCEVCAGTVSISVDKDHRGDFEVVTAPTCAATGTAKLEKCLDCDVVSKDAPYTKTLEALEFVPAYKFDATITLDKDAKVTGDIIIYCANDNPDEDDDCTHTVETIDLATIKEFKNKTLADAKSVTKPTCKVDGAANYVVKVVAGDEVLTFEFAAVIAKLGCTKVADLKSTDDIFVVSKTIKVEGEDDKVLYYAVFECKSCGDFQILDLELLEADYYDLEKVEAAIVEFKADLAEKEAAEAED